MLPVERTNRIQNIFYEHIIKSCSTYKKMYTSYVLGYAFCIFLIKFSIAYSKAYKKCHVIILRIKSHHVVSCFCPNVDVVA